MIQQTRQRGVTLLEQLIALAALVFVGTAAMLLMGSTERARRESQPAADRVWTRATAASELALCESAAANLAYFDLTATVAAARASAGSGSGGGGGSKTTIGLAATPPPSTPPHGFCGPVVLGNPASWPPGFDPRNNTTWSSVEWWSGASTSDPSTWYYRCASPSSGGRLTPVYSYGDGVVFVGGDHDARIPIVGPAAAVPDTSPLFGDQVGDALAMLRTEPSLPRLSLGATFDSSSNTIRFVAGDPATLEAIGGLAAGDVLVVTGSAATGETRTAIAELSASPQPIFWPSPLDATGQPILRYFEASILPPSSTFRWGLRNTEGSATGVRIEADASVAVLDRSGGVVVFYTAHDSTGTSLVKVTGGMTPDPQQLGPVAQQIPLRHTLVRDVATSLRAQVRTVTVGAGGTARTVASGLTVAMPISGEEGAANVEPLASTVEFLASALTNSKLGFEYGTISETVTFPSPGVDGGGLIDDEDEGPSGGLQ